MDGTNEGFLIIFYELIWIKKLVHHLKWTFTRQILALI